MAERQTITLTLTPREALIVSLLLRIHRLQAIRERLARARTRAEVRARKRA